MYVSLNFTVFIVSIVSILRYVDKKSFTIFFSFLSEMDESQNKVRGRKIDLNVPAKVQRPWMTKENNG